MRRIFCVLGLIHLTAHADLVNLANGDRFTGEVQSVNATEVELKSDSLGIVKIPRAKVASIYFGTNLPPAKASIAARSGLDPKAVEDVQKEFLATATPEANAMFTDLVQGLASGKLSIDDIRKQAADSLKELNELQAELGEEADNPLLKSYAGILEKFIKAGTNKPAAAPLPNAK